ncbi:LacI family DNA-binding transcriptional regulator [Massiliimalia massiliensis]|uniref:LacI family DNA-binding transcriptional regulator n=1 Tax=Massiliimalia massiliensis TaxID=1852384 RepID=UPI0009848EBF|nr:LacI family DNA-binding transcriptional regulator [Massiliimalia massiliensis]
MSTLKDVSERAGVTVTTVSRVLNNRGYISEKTRAKVYQSMKELNYQPNELARSLTKKHSNMIGVIVPTIQHPFFSQLTFYLEQYCFKKNFKILLCNSQAQVEKEKEYIDMLKSNQVAGIIIASRTPDVEQYVEQDMPIVMIERQSGGYGINICCDNELGGELATRHLIACGCKKLLHISGEFSKGLPGDKRAVAFERVCQEVGVPYQIFTTTEQEFYTRSYAEIIREVFAQMPDVDGIFASNDTMAAQILQYCYDHGIDVPGQLQVVGFDDVELCHLTTPQLTTIRQPIERMAEAAVNSILGRRGKKAVAMRTILPVELKMRGSTRLKSE